jgi:signal transduction histidine kinase
MVRNYSQLDELLIIFLTSVLIVAGYRPLERFIEKATDRIFFKRKRDFHAAFFDFSRELDYVVDTERLLRLIVDGIDRTIRPDRVAMLVRKEPSGWQGIRKEHLANGEHIHPVGMEEDEVLEKMLSGKNKLVIYGELKDQSLRSRLDRIGAAVYLPVTVKGRIAGILAIGGKLSEEPYTIEELDLLQTFSGRAAIALENSRLVEKEKKMQEDLLRTEELALLGKFAGGIAHEIRNPLVCIKSFFQIMNDPLEGAQEKKELSEIAYKEILRIEELLKNMIDFVRSSEQDRQPVEIGELIRETANLAGPELAARNIKLTVQNHARRLPAFFDRKQLKQVFLNLVYNAIQAMPGGGSLQIEVDRSADGEKILIVFQDSGQGIADKDLKRIFEPFYSTKPGGSGLGLSISEKIIRSHRGEIRVVSKLNRGTRFEIVLPINSTQNSQPAHI